MPTYDRTFPILGGAPTRYTILLPPNSRGTTLDVSLTETRITISSTSAFEVRDETPERDVVEMPSNSEAQECAICSDTLSEEFIETHCGHIFCTECLMKWVEQAMMNGDRSANCPYCRDPLTWCRCGQHSIGVRDRPGHLTDYPGEFWALVTTARPGSDQPQSEKWRMAACVSYSDGQCRMSGFRFGSMGMDASHLPTIHIPYGKFLSALAGKFCCLEADDTSRISRMWLTKIFDHWTLSEACSYAKSALRVSLQRTVSSDLVSVWDRNLTVHFDDYFQSYFIGLYSEDPSSRRTNHEEDPKFAVGPARLSLALHEFGMLTMWKVECEIDCTDASGRLFRTQHWNRWRQRILQIADIESNGFEYDTLRTLVGQAYQTRRAGQFCTINLFNYDLRWFEETAFFKIKSRLEIIGGER